MTQMKLSMKQKQDHRCREQMVVAKGGGVREDWNKRLVLAHVSFYV